MKDRKGKRCKGVDFLSAQGMTEPPEGSGLRSFAALKEKGKYVLKTFDFAPLESGFRKGEGPGSFATLPGIAATSQSGLRRVRGPAGSGKLTRLLGRPRP